VAATAGVCLTLAPEDQQQAVAMEDEAESQIREGASRRQLAAVAE
jgi:outer membrane protein assembly factor BamE (lipoprotein component of BamABCDE complex)